MEKHLDTNWFEVIAAGDIVPHKKPSPDIYNYVLKNMDLKPEECLVFEDSFHGLQASSGANLKTIITLHDYTRNQDFSLATLVLNHLGEPHHEFTLVKGNLPNKVYFDLEVAKILI